MPCLGPHYNRTDAVWYHQRTALWTRRLNWIACSAPCREDNDGHYWNGIWADYYAGLPMNAALDLMPK